MLFKFIAQLSLASLATAHFGLEYPEWRAPTLGSTNPNVSQWLYPCGGVPPGAGNVTAWPLTGGSVVLDLHHPWSYIFINLGLGTNVTNFNMTLTPMFLNETGNGTFCLPKVEIPAEYNLTDGTAASLQVITLGDSGSALYNCADIMLSSTAEILSGDMCMNSTGLTAVFVTDQTSSNDTGSGKPSAASSSRAGSTLALAGVVALMVALGFGSVF